MKLRLDINLKHLPADEEARRTAIADALTFAERRVLQKGVPQTTGVAFLIYQGDFRVGKAEVVDE